MILVVVPVIFFIVLYAYRYFSDEISAIETFSSENDRDEEKEEEIVSRKSKKSEEPK